MKSVTYEMPKVFAIDDWMVWGKLPDGSIVETCAEMWPEWLDQVRAPEDMGGEEYRKAILQILRHKRPAWAYTFAEHRFADAEERQMILTDLQEMEIEQAAFIAEFK